MATIVRGFLAAGVKESSIGVICMYGAQVLYSLFYSFSHIYFLQIIVIFFFFFFFSFGDFLTSLVGQCCCEEIERRCEGQHC